LRAELSVAYNLKERPLLRRSYKLRAAGDILPQGDDVTWTCQARESLADALGMK